MQLLKFLKSIDKRTVLAASTVIGLGIVIFTLLSELSSMRTEFREQSTEMVNLYQKASAGILGQTVRRNVVINMRDEIRRVNKSISVQKAFKIAEIFYDKGTAYSVDPLLLFALAKHESRFNDSIVKNGVKVLIKNDSSGASGPFQFLPSTARILCRAHFPPIEYSEGVMGSWETATELEALYMYICGLSYNGNIDLMIADHSGGPREAVSYKNNKPVREQTTLMIRDVRKTLENLKRTIQENGSLSSEMTQEDLEKVSRKDSLGS
jgi:hypothetical protein